MISNTRSVSLRKPRHPERHRERRPGGYHRRMRRILLAVAALLSAPAVAHAGNETFLGWSDDGWWWASVSESCAQQDVSICRYSTAAELPDEVAKVVGESDTCGGFSPQGDDGHGLTL